MRILQLGKFYPIRGGVEKVMWDLARGLAERGSGDGFADADRSVQYSDCGSAGVSCDMLCAMLPDDGIDEADKSLMTSGEGEWPRIMQFTAGSGRTEGNIAAANSRAAAIVPSRCICVRAMAKKAATMISPAMIRWLRRHAREYDLIDVHHPDPMACLALRLSGYKGRVFVHWHSDILRQKGLLKLYTPFQNWLLKRAERIIGTTPVYVAESPWLKNFQNKVCHIPIGVDDTMRVRTDASDSRFVRIFSLGRLVEYKGYRYLVEAAARLPENYKVEIAGDGPLRDELQMQIKTLGLENKVTLSGYLTDDEVRRKMNGCDVFVLPSVMKTEAFGIVQIEAMSCGKPVVATTIPGSGTSWVNAHGVSGLNVPPCDAKALADAITAICENPETRAGFSRDARLRYERLFTLDEMVENYMKLI